MEEELSEQSSALWRNWGTMQNGRCLTADILECHKTGKGCSLSDILEDEVDEKYFLSEKEWFNHLNKKHSMYIQKVNNFILKASMSKDFLYEEEKRFLTPKECFRLQGFPDEYFERAAKVNSDSQLYKQAGNSVTVNVIYEIAKGLI
jgi:site-specific DNA-cytosine methylase